MVGWKRPEGGLEVLIPIYWWFYPGEDPKFPGLDRIIHYHLHYIHFHETWNHAFTPDSHYSGPGFFKIGTILGEAVPMKRL